MAIRYTREQCLDRLRAEIAAGRGLLMTGAGNGIAAKFIERGGVDLIGVYNTGYFRMQGYGSLAGMLPILDSNELVFRTAEREVLPQVKSTPVIAGVNGVDPLRDMRALPRDRCARSASPASTIFRPSPGSTASFRRSLEATGLGYEHEIRMLNLARELDMLTIGYAFNAEDTRRLMKRGRARHLHLPRRHHRRRRDRRRRCRFARRYRRAERTPLRHRARDQAGRDPARPRRRDRRSRARRIHARPHGCHGVQLGSSIERMAIERPIEARTAAFKAAKPPPRET